MHIALPTFHHFCRFSTNCQLRKPLHVDFYFDTVSNLDMFDDDKHKLKAVLTFSDCFASIFHHFHFLSPPRSLHTHGLRLKFSVDTKQGETHFGNCLKIRQAKSMGSSYFQPVPLRHQFIQSQASWYSSQPGGSWTFVGSLSFWPGWPREQVAAICKHWKTSKTMKCLRWWS